MVIVSPKKVYSQSLPMRHANVSIVSSIDGFNSFHANAKIKIFNRFCLNSEQRFVYMGNRVCSWLY